MRAEVRSAEVDRRMRWDETEQPNLSRKHFIHSMWVLREEEFSNLEQPPEKIR